MIEYQIFENIWNGEFEDAFQKANELSQTDELKGKIYLSYLYLLMSKLEKTWETISHILEGKYGELTEFESIIVKIIHSNALFRRYKDEEAISKIDFVLKRFKEIKDKNNKIMRIWEILANVSKSNYHLRKHNYDDGIINLKRAIEIAEMEDLPLLLAVAYNNLGNMYSESGDLETGESYVNKSLIIALNTEKAPLCCQYGTLAEIHLRRGKLEEAVNYGEQAIEIVEKRCTPEAIACYQEILGGIYFKMGNNDRAVDLITKGKDNRADLQMYASVGLNMRNLARIELDRGNLEQAKIYHENLQKLYSDTKLDYVDYFYKFTHALILMQSKRVTNIAKSQDIFRELLKFEKLFGFEEIDIYLNLCNLLIHELKIADDEEVINELTDLTDKMYDIAHKRNIKSLLAEIITIKAKVALIRGNIDEALELIDEAKHLIENMGQVRLEERISNFEHEIRENYMEWKSIVSSDSSYNKKIEKSMIENYITSSIKLRNNYEYFPT